MGEMTFNFPPALMAWIEAQVAEGRYADAADYLRDLVRRDLAVSGDEREDIELIRNLIEEGEASGMSEVDPFAFIDGLIAKRRASFNE
jgi:antitoxin ParD1/3/4